MGLWLHLHGPRPLMGHFEPRFGGVLFDGISMISVAECQTHAEECERLGRVADISIQRATALLAMAHTWEMLADEITRYEAIVMAETVPTARRVG
jgi:hypothetical protein